MIRTHAYLFKEFRKLDMDCLKLEKAMVQTEMPELRRPLEVKECFLATTQNMLQKMKQMSNQESYKYSISLKKFYLSNKW